eukprot:2541413-Pyramimonas_sp.AAC.1
MRGEETDPARGTLAQPAPCLALEYLGEELNSPVAEWLNKGLTAVWSPTCGARAAAPPPAPVPPRG